MSSEKHNSIVQDTRRPRNNNIIPFKSFKMAFCETYQHIHRFFVYLLFELHFCLGANAPKYL